MNGVENAIEDNIFMARIAEQGERYQDMVDFLKMVIEQKGADMSTDERSLLSIAFKNVVAPKRTAWRTVISVQNNHKHFVYQASILEYRQKLEDAIFNDCSNIIAMI